MRSGTDLLAVDCERVTVGRVGADVVLDEVTVSRLHAFIDRVSGGWVLEDLGSRNGTFLNGTRLTGPRAIRNGDEIRFGSASTVFRTKVPDEEPHGSTEPLRPAPTLTPRERDALIALCRPLLEGSVLTEPASLRAIAAELVITESGAKKLMARAFDKFDLAGDERRRSRLAMEALRRGAVSIADAAPSTR